MNYKNLIETNISLRTQLKYKLDIEPDYQLAEEIEKALLATLPTDVELAKDENQQLAVLLLR
jgi:hypothetical protein